MDTLQVSETKGDAIREHCYLTDSVRPEALLQNPRREQCFPVQQRPGKLPAAPDRQVPEGRGQDGDVERLAAIRR